MIPRSFNFLLGLLFFYCVKGYDILLAEGDTVQNKAVKLVCKSDNITGLVAFVNNHQVSVATCFHLRKCTPNDGYTVTQNIAKQETYLTIPFCTGSVEGIWHCFHKNDAQYNLSCTDPPETVEITKQTENKTTCTSECSDVVSSFRFELLDVDSKAILHTSTVTAAADLSVGCTENSKRAYSASFEVLYDHAPDKTVKIRCHAIAKSIKESENIPYATTGRSITLNGVDIGHVMITISVIIALVVLLIWTLFQIKRIQHLVTSNNGERRLIILQIVKAQMFIIVCGLFLVELKSDRYSVISNNWENDSLPTIFTTTTASLFIVFGVIVLIYLIHIRRSRDSKNMESDILPIILSTVIMLASVVVLLIIMRLMKCHSSLTTNDLDNYSLPTFMTAAMAPMFVATCIVFLIRICHSNGSQYDRCPIIIPIMIIITIMSVFLCVMILVQLKCYRRSNILEDRALSIVFLTETIAIAFFVPVIFKVRLKCTQLSRSFNDPDQKATTQMEFETSAIYDNMEERLMNFDEAVL